MFIFSQKYLIFKKKKLKNQMFQFEICGKYRENVKISRPLIEDVRYSKNACFKMATSKMAAKGRKCIFLQFFGF